jgi:1-hydroxycarotenoid 3,4-desaturase
MQSMNSAPVIVVGAGVGGLGAAVDLRRQGRAVVVVEAAARAGGKLHQKVVRGLAVDAGPTVLTMRWAFDELFSDAGQSLADHVTLRRAETLARHAFADGSTLDLYADRQRSADAIGALAGPAEARGYLAFCAHARRIYEAVEGPFLRSQRPGPTSGWRRSPASTGTAACGGRSPASSTTGASASSSAGTPRTWGRRRSRRRLR